ncbi:MAG: ribosome maturation factor RimM, partial [Actinomycetota bacterium]
VRGDIYIDLITDREERLAVGARLQAGGRWLTVASARRAGTRWLVHFDDVPDRTAAEKLVNLPLLAEPLEPTGDGLYVHDLIGAEVFDTTGAVLGTCTSVLANPAHDILELDNGGLVPVVFVVEATEGRVVVDPPEGLFDLA